MDGKVEVEGGGMLLEKPPSGARLEKNAADAELEPGGVGKFRAVATAASIRKNVI